MPILLTENNRIKGWKLVPCSKDKQGAHSLSAWILNIPSTEFH